jgi:mannose-6-phosphate isomerase-like protein (cupin superfamily)
VKAPGPQAEQSKRRRRIIMQKINLAEKLAMFSSHWDPKVVARYNGNDIMVVKFAGEFPFHKHDNTDDFFLVIEGNVTMEYADHPPVTFGPGEIVVVPKGVVHRPRAATEAKVLLIEPTGEPNTGDSGLKAAEKPMI